MTAMMDRCECTCGKAACASVRGRKHGTGSCYRDGCRCDECRKYNSDRVWGRHKAINDESQERAVKSRQQWTSAELETVLRDDLSIAEIAAMLGRSFSAVSTMRSKCRHDPRYSQAAGVPRARQPEPEQQGEA